MAILTLFAAGGGAAPALARATLAGACLAAAGSLLALQAGAAEAPPEQAADTRAAGGDRAAAVSEDLVFQNIPVVITASRHEQRASDAPASVAVITAAEIERQGYRTIGDALQSVPGFYINYDRDYTYIGVRGFARPGDYNSRIQMQINGHPMNDNVWDYSAVGEDQALDISMVERIEVVYGPGSALYGSNALFATVNVITKPPKSVEGTELALEGASYGRGQARVQYGGSAGAWGLASSASVLHAAGPNLFYPEYAALGMNGGVADGTDFEKGYRFYGQAEHGPLFIQASSLYRTKGIPTGAFATVFDEDATRETDVRNFLDVQYRRPLSSRLDFLIRGSYDEYRYWGTYRYDAGGGSLVDNIDRSTGRWLSEETQVDFRLSSRQRLVFGQGFIENTQAIIQNFDENPFVQYADVGTKYDEFFVYAQHEATPAPGWHLTTGLRYDDYSSFGSAVSPRFALVYGPRPSWRLKFLAGHAFRAPNVYELFYESYAYVPPSSLDPEVTTSYEIAFESALSSRLDLRATLFEDRISDLISLMEIAPGVNQFHNLDRAVTRGGEISLRGRLASAASGYLSFSYMQAEDGDGNQLTNYPPESWKAGASVPFGRQRWWASANLQYYDRRLTLAGTMSPTVFLTNVTLEGPRLRGGARLSASVYNLFDRDYGLPASAEHQDLVLIPQDGRTFSVRAAWSF